MRFLIYSPDSYGLGHVRRSTLLAKTILKRVCGASALLLTGAPRAHLFEYPKGCDYLKLPSVTKDAEGRYVSRDLDLSIEEAIGLRERMIRLAAESFPADALIVDHSPLGLCGEILPTLRKLGESSNGTVRILGMRDVIDDPDAVRAAWERDGVLDVLDSCYDMIMVYGDREIFDPIEAYAIPPSVARKMIFVGYIPRNGRKAHPQELKARYAPRTGKLVAVTLGGGGDGNLVLRSFLEGYEKLGDQAPFEVAAVTGPLMSPGKRDRFRSWAERLPGLTLLDYTPEVPDLFEAADFSVSMGGYNTVCELACAGARALIVPRTFPRKEQLIRARILARRGVAGYMLCDSRSGLPDPEVLIGHILDGLDNPQPEKGWGLGFTGLDLASEAVTELVRSRPDTPPASLQSAGS